MILKNAFVLFVIVCGCLLVRPAQAGTLSGANLHDTWLEQESLSRLSVGADIENIERDIDLDGFTSAKLEAQYLSGYAGFDLTRWMSLFATAGASRARLDYEDDYADNKMKWSLGLNANWWHIDITDPSFMEGRCSLVSSIEYARLKSGDDQTQLDWNSYFASFLVNYEIFVSKIEDVQKHPYSLALFAGPVYSKLDGTCSFGSSADADFSEAHSVGLAGGATVFASHNLSAGCQVEYYDDMTFHASLRYHF